MQRRFTPTLTAIQNHTLRYPQNIARTDDVNFRVTSTPFTFNGKTCIVRNRLSSNILEVFDTVNTEVEVDNVGSYANDTVSGVGLQIDAMAKRYIYKSFCCARTINHLLHHNTRRA